MKINKDICTEPNVDFILEQAEHLLRMKEQKQVKQVWQIEIKGKRPNIRPAERSQRWQCAGQKFVEAKETNSLTWQKCWTWKKKLMKVIHNPLLKQSLQKKTKKKKKNRAAQEYCHIITVKNWNFWLNIIYSF